MSLIGDAKWNRIKTDKSAETYKLIVEINKALKVIRN